MTTFKRIPKTTSAKELQRKIMRLELSVFKAYDDKLREKIFLQLGQLNKQLEDERKKIR